MMTDTYICKKHDGIERDLKHLRASDKAQWKEIKGMQRWLIASMTALILTLATALINLAILLSKG